jgi:hypothetical protein
MHGLVIFMDLFFKTILYIVFMTLLILGLIFIFSPFLFNKKTSFFFVTLKKSSKKFINKKSRAKKFLTKIKIKK